MSDEWGIYREIVIDSPLRANTAEHLSSWCSAEWMREEIRQPPGHFDSTKHIEGTLRYYHHVRRLLWVWADEKGFQLNWTWEKWTRYKNEIKLENEVDGSHWMIVAEAYIYSLSNYCKRNDWDVSLTQECIQYIKVD